MNRKTLGDTVSVLSDVAGVLGFILALALGWIAWREHQTGLSPTIRLGPLQGHTPLAGGPSLATNLGDCVVFTLHHDQGPDIPIQVVFLRLAAKEDTSEGSRSMGDGFTSDVSSDAIRLLCWPIAGDGSVVRPEARLLPFQRGGTRYYALPSRDFMEYRRRYRTDARHWALLQVWSQDQVLAEYDISRYLNGTLNRAQ